MAALLMDKNRKDTRYSVVVFSDAASAGSPRRWSVGKRTVRALAGGAAFLALVFGYFAWHYGQTYNVWSVLDDARAERLALTEENARYAAKIQDILAYQATIEERIGKLATMVGVETLGDTLSVGGTGGFTANDLAFSAPGLPVEPGRRVVNIEAGHSLFDHNLGELEHIYREKQQLLGFVPSIWPVEGIITTAHGWRRDPFTGQPEFHAAVDISCRTGTPIKAPADGVVTSVGYSTGYGNNVVVSHGFGYVTRYAHLHAFNVKSGQALRRGDVLGYVGSTGRSTGPHLHYEILLNNKAVNARNFVLEEVRRF
jgi:hypothetical protein